MSRPADTEPLDLAQLKRVNACCNRFEAAWKAGASPRIEDFQEDAADLELLRHLVLLDVDYRRQRGDTPRPDDYLKRFPTLSSEWLHGELTGASRSDTHVDAAAWAVSASEFLDRLARQGLLSPGECAELRSETSAATVARQLIEQGRLAEFQARALSAPAPVPLTLGPYVLDGWIGAGGMGSVFRATHRQMQRPVALKVMHGEAAARPEQRQRFQREVVLAARLRHPHIITAFDAGEEQGITYLVTELVPGEDLGRLVKRGGPLPAERAVDLIRQATLGLGHAHAQGIIHRDVKPSNLMLGEDGVVRVLDVGLARALSAGDDPPANSADMPAAAGLTAAGAIMGTIAYMAPEQARDPRLADERSDIYSLGCTLWYLLIGQPPSSPGASIRRLRSAIDAALDQTIQRMMAERPADRFPTMAATREALESRPTRRISRRALLASAGVAALGAAAIVMARRERTMPSPAVIPFDGSAVQAAWAQALDLPVEIQNSVGMRFRLIPPGSFLKGTRADIIQQRSRGVPPHEATLLSWEKQRPATIATPFYLGVTEVTIGQFRRFVNATGHVTKAEKAVRDEEGGWVHSPQAGWQRRVGGSWRHSGELATGDDHPAGNITWDDALAFCRWLTLATGVVCRLPTEAEWEFACRAGQAGAWCFGDEEAALPLYAWMEQTGGNVFHPVGRKRGNAFGLHDMHGNLTEWCQSDDGDRPPPAEIGLGSPNFHAARGGMFLSTADRTRSGARHWEHDDAFGPGFRVLQAIPSKGAPVAASK